MNVPHSETRNAQIRKDRQIMSAQELAEKYFITIRAIYFILGTHRKNKLGNCKNHPDRPREGNMYLCSECRAEYFRKAVHKSYMKKLLEGN